MSQRPEPSPYHATSMGLTLLEYYRRLLICIVKESGNSGLIKGEDLLNVSATDGLLLRYDKAGVILRVEESDTNWEAHVGTPGTKDPASWVVPKRPHIEAAHQPARETASATDERLAELEKRMLEESAARAVIEGEAGTRGQRLPFYTSDKPKGRKEPTQ